MLLGGDDIVVCGSNINEMRDMNLGEMRNGRYATRLFVLLLFFHFIPSALTTCRMNQLLPTSHIYYTYIHRHT